LAPGEQREFWGFLAAFASRARKVGMASIGLATDPAFRAPGQGGLNYRSQCARISFRLLQAAGSRAILDAGGAEGLAEGQFLALLDPPGLVPGVTANPGREELAAYLDGQAVTAVVEPAWLPAACRCARWGRRLLTTCFDSACRMRTSRIPTCAPEPVPTNAAAYGRVNALTQPPNRQKPLAASSARPGASHRGCGKPGLHR
jgi:hypothetical protein